MTEEERINRVNELVKERWEAQHLGAKLSIGEPTALSPQDGWQRRHDPERGLFDFTPRPDYMWQVKVEADYEVRVWKGRLLYACWVRGTMPVGAGRRNDEDMIQIALEEMTSE